MSLNKTVAARAAAILTNGEVAAATLSTAKVANAKIAVHVDFTIGSLTNVILKWYVSADGSTWVPLEDSAGNVSKTLTATATRTLVFDCTGWESFRVSATGTDTVTSSSLTINYKYRKRGAQ